MEKTGSPDSILCIIGEGAFLSILLLIGKNVDE
jgi:hypothetical protein